jgi:hypothetical protein
MPWLQEGGQFRLVGSASMDVWNEHIHGRSTYEPYLTIFLYPRNIPTRINNITMSSAPDDGHMVARNLLSIW